MSFPRSVLMFVLFALPGVPAYAQSSVEVAGTCLTDHSSGSDRKLFVKWMFIAMAKHPEIADLATVGADTEASINTQVGGLVTRLLTDDCGPELRTMIQEHGPSSLTKAFEVFGRVAMIELMSNPQVGAAMSALDQYTDQQKIQGTLRVD